MAGGGPGRGLTASLQSAFEARLKTDLAGVSSTLTLDQYSGDLVVVSNTAVIVPDTGLTRNVADNLITAAGADAGVAGSANTLYHVYISNARASFSPSSIRLSATGPALVGGVKYLGVAGNALNWRFVGWVRLNATPKFVSDDMNAGIANYYNRVQKDIQGSPNYANSNAYQFTAIPAGNWAVIAGATLDTISFIANGEDEYVSSIFGMLQANASNGYIGAGLDGAIEPVAAALCQNGGLIASVTCSRLVKVSEGYHTLQFIAASDAGANFYHDTPRLGATVGPVVTGFNLTVFV